MSRRTLNLAAAGAVCAVLAWVVGGILGSTGPSQPAPVAEDDAEFGSSPTPIETGPAGQTSATGAAPEEEALVTRQYALAAPEVEGLPLDLPSGTALELWVAWEPPLTKEPQIRRLIPRAIYERIVPATIEGGPPTAVISVPVERVRDLMYGDRYGSLSAVVLAG